MLKNNVRYIERERSETANPDELYFKRLEELSLKKINNMRRVAKNNGFYCHKKSIQYLTIQGICTDLEFLAK